MKKDNFFKIKISKLFLLFNFFIVIFYFSSIIIFAQNYNWVSIEEFKKFSNNKAKSYLDEMILKDPGNSNIYKYILILKSDQKKYFEKWASSLNKNSVSLDNKFIANSFIVSFFLNNVVMIDYYYEYGFKYLNDNDKAIFYYLYKTLTMNFYSNNKDIEEVVITILQKLDGFLYYSIYYLYENENLINIIIKNADKIDLKNYQKQLQYIYKNSKNYFLIENFIYYFQKYDNKYLIESLNFLHSHKDINANIMALEISIKIDMFDKLDPSKYKKILYSNDIGFVVNIFSRLLDLKPQNKKLEDLLFERYNNLPDSLKSVFIKIFYKFYYLDVFTFFLNSYDKTNDSNLKLEMKNLLTFYMNNRYYSKDALLKFIDGIIVYNEEYFRDLAFKYLNAKDVQIKTYALRYFHYNFSFDDKKFLKDFQNKIYNLILEEEDEKFISTWFLVVSKNNLKDIYVSSFNEFFSKLKKTENNIKLKYYIRYIDYFKTTEIFITIINSNLKLDRESIIYIDNIFKRGIDSFSDSFISGYFYILKKNKESELLNYYLNLNDRVSLICLKVITDYKDKIFIPNLIYLLQKDEEISNLAIQILINYELSDYYKNIFNILLFENYNYLKSIITIIKTKRVKELQYLGNIIYLLKYHKNDNFYYLIKDFLLEYFEKEDINIELFTYFYNARENSIEILNESLNIFKNKKDYNSIRAILKLLKEKNDLKENSKQIVDNVFKILDIKDKNLLFDCLDLLKEFDCTEYNDNLISLFDQYKDDYLISIKILDVLKNSYSETSKEFIKKILDKTQSFEIKKKTLEIIKKIGNEQYIDLIINKLDDLLYYETLQGIYNNIDEKEKENLIEKVKENTKNREIDYLLFILDGIKKGNINNKDKFSLKILLKNYDKIYKYIFYEDEIEQKRLISLIIASDYLDKHFERIKNILDKKEIIGLISFGLASNNIEKQQFALKTLINYKFDDLKDTLEFLKYYNFDNYKKYLYLYALDKNFNFDTFMYVINMKDKNLTINLLILLKNLNFSNDFLINLSNFPEYFVFINSDMSNIEKLNDEDKNKIFNNLVEKGNLSNIEFLKYLENYSTLKLYKENLYKLIETYINFSKGIGDFKGNISYLEEIILNQLSIRENFVFVTDPKISEFINIYKDLNKDRLNLVFNTLKKLKYFKYAYYFIDSKDDQLLFASSLYSTLTESQIIYFQKVYEDTFYKMLTKINKINIEISDEEFFIEIIKNSKSSKNLSLLLSKFDFKYFEHYIFNDNFFEKLNKDEMINIFIIYQKLINYDLSNSNLNFLIYLNNYNFDKIFTYSYFKKFKKINLLIYNRIKYLIEIYKLENIKNLINILF
jgi:hypothetical protein